MDVTRILSRQLLAREAAVLIYCLPTNPIVTTGSDGTHPRDGTTVHLSKNASQQILPLAAGLIARSTDKKRESTHFQLRVNLLFSIFEDLFFGDFSAAFRGYSQPAIRTLVPAETKSPAMPHAGSFARPEPTSRASTPPVAVGSQQARH